MHMHKSFTIFDAFLFDGIIPSSSASHSTKKSFSIGLACSKGRYLHFPTCSNI